MYVIMHLTCTLHTHTLLHLITTNLGVSCYYVSLIASLTESPGNGSPYFVNILSLYKRRAWRWYSAIPTREV